MPAFSDGGVIDGKLEYDVKAALLYRCLELIEWPADTSAAEQATLTVGILGKNQFGESLNCLVGKTVSGRRLIVTKLSRLSQVERCQLVFISASETKRTSKILNSLAGMPVLTVGEIPGFTEQGGIMNLLLVGKNIRLEINPAAAGKSGIVFDQKLIELANLQAEANLTRNNPSSP
jgi:hypothetical protein